MNVIDKEVDIFKYNRDEKGNILLKESEITRTGIETLRCLLAKEWIILPDGTMALIKKNNRARFEKFSAKEKKISYYNNFFLPELCSRFEVPSAKYYPVKITDEDGNVIEENILTPIFLDKGEELIHATDILGFITNPQKEFFVKDIFEKMRIFLKTRKFPEEEIDDFEDDFIRQTIFNRFIKHVDERSENWGIIVNGRHVRLAPNYGMTFSCGLTKKERYTRGVNDLGENNLALVFQTYKRKKWMKEYLERVISRIDIDDCCKKVEEKTGVHISPSVRKYYNTYFADRFSEFKGAYYKLFRKGEKLL